MKRTLFIRLLLLLVGFAVPAAALPVGLLERANTEAPRLASFRTYSTQKAYRRKIKSDWEHLDDFKAKLGHKNLQTVSDKDLLTVLASLCGFLKEARTSTSKRNWNSASMGETYGETIMGWLGCTAIKSNRTLRTKRNRHPIDAPPSRSQARKQPAAAAALVKRPGAPHARDRSSATPAMAVAGTRVCVWVGSNFSGRRRKN